MANKKTSNKISKIEKNNEEVINKEIIKESSETIQSIEKIVDNIENNINTNDEKTIINKVEKKDIKSNIKQKIFNDEAYYYNDLK